MSDKYIKYGECNQCGLCCLISHNVKDRCSIGFKKVKKK